MSVGKGIVAVVRFNLGTKVLMRVGGRWSQVDGTSARTKRVTTWPVALTANCLSMDGNLRMILSKCSWSLLPPWYS